MKKVLLTTALLSTLLFTNCKKEETTKTTPVKTKTDLITSAKWKTTAFTVNPGIDIGGSIITDFYTQMDDCDKDDTEKFEVGGLGSSDEGSTKCDPMDPQTVAFTWSFTSNETKLIQDTDTYDIISLTESELIISQIVDGTDIGGTPGLKYKLTMTTKH